MLAVVVAACAARALWPGDVQFVYDEPKLVLNALQANADHALARAGLVGNVGVRYGPTPTWLYQLAAAVTHDLRWWVAVRGVTLAALSVLGLWWCAQACGWRSRGLLVAVLASPYLWYFDRVLWDNTFAIPLVALAWGAYGRWLVSGACRFAVVWTLALCVLPSIHLMSVAFVVPMATHAVVDALRRRRVGDVLLASVPALLVAGVLAGTYGPALLDDLPGQSHPRRAASALDVLYGPEWMTGHGLTRLYEPGWWGRGPLPTLLVKGSAGLSLGAFALVAWGVVALVRSGAGPFSRQAGESPGDREGASRQIVRTYTRLALAMLVAHAVVGYWAGPQRFAHYLAPTWVIWPFAMWFGLEMLPRPARRAATGTLIASLVVVTASNVVMLHRDRGVREGIYGPSLGELRSAAAQIGRGPVVIRADGVANLARFPVPLTALRALLPSDARARCLDVTVAYASPSGTDARLTVVCTGQPGGP